MHVYILFAHPGERSFCRDVLGAFTEGLRMSGHTFQVHDLYRAGYQSEMDQEQYIREMAGDPNAKLPEDVEKEHQQIERADALAFIFPVWWSDAPAKLKGWFDRVWSYGYAYFYQKDGPRLSRIKPKRAIIICSAGHTEAELGESGIADSMKRIFIQDRLQNVGFTDVKMEILGGMMPNDPTHRDESLKRVRRLCGTL